MVFFTISDHDFFCGFLTFVGVCICAVSGFAIKAVDKSLVGLVREIFTVESFEQFFAFAKQWRFVKTGQGLKALRSLLSGKLLLQVRLFRRGGGMVRPVL